MGKDDVNPVWNETFTFNIPTLDNMVLSMNLFDHDVGSRDDKCGKCKIKLEREGITSRPKLIEKTVDRNLLRANGKIFVEVSYHLIELNCSVCLPPKNNNETNNRTGETLFFFMLIP